jgi:hypothetical protein
MPILQYCNETGNTPTYKRGDSYHHTLEYVLWLEKRVVELENEKYELYRSFTGR